MPSQLLASRLGGRLWVALIENGELCELDFERSGQSARKEQIYKARVTRVTPAIQAAFVDLGGEGEAFLHAAELWLPGEPPLSRSPRETGAALLPPIEQRLKVGRDLVVQVTGESHGSKGPRVSCALSFPGRDLVYAPFVDGCAVSGRIRDVAERERLLGELRALDAAEGGFIARTAAAGATTEQLGEEAARLVRTWREVRDASEKRGAPGLIHGRPELLEHSLRDAPLQELEAIVCDDPQDRDRAVGFLSALGVVPPTELRLHTGPVSPFEQHAVFAAADSAFRPDVRLPSGGRLVIEETEAMISIDVDSGRDLAGGSAGQTALRVNLEAVREIPRQLRLRNLAGTIVVDLIRLTDKASRQRVVDEIEQAAVKDRGRLRVAALTEHGLLQLTRRRVGPNLAESLGTRCPQCGARGRIKNAIFVAAELIEALRRRARGHEAPGVFHVRAHPSVLEELQGIATECELWPGAGPSKPSFEPSGADETPDRFEIRRPS